MAQLKEPIKSCVNKVQMNLMEKLTEGFIVDWIKIEETVNQKKINISIEKSIKNAI